MLRELGLKGMGKMDSPVPPTTWYTHRMPVQIGPGQISPVIRPLNEYNPLERPPWGQRLLVVVKSCAFWTEGKGRPARLRVVF